MKTRNGKTIDELMAVITNLNNKLDKSDKAVKEWEILFTTARAALDTQKLYIESLKSRIELLEKTYTLVESEPVIVHLYPFDGMSREEIERIAFDINTPQEMAAAAITALKRVA